ncbi:gamma-glutamyltransferase [Clostridioides difficile]
MYPTAGEPYCGGTVYLCTADKDGNMVSYIQSNYINFGYEKDNIRKFI